jgi:hypothetical protein
MGKLQFLTDTWLDTVFGLQAEYSERVPAPLVKMRMNQVAGTSGRPSRQITLLPVSGH